VNEHMHASHTNTVARAVRLMPRPAAALVLLAATGCRSTRPDWSVEEHARPPVIIRIVEGDELDIRFLGADHLNVVQRVRRDGNIALPLVGEVRAAGKRMEELRAELAEKYAPQLQTHETTIIINSTPPVLVSGAVMLPGRILMDRPLTALAAIAEAGGFDATQAEVRSVVVIRHGEGGRKGFILNLKSAIEGQPYRPFYLEPYDIVYVPRTRIVKINQFVNQYINGLLPRLGLAYSSTGETTFVR